MTTTPGPTSQVARQEPAGTSRSRRPTGTPPPLPKSIGTSGKLWVAMVGAIAVLSVLLLRLTPVLRAVDHVDAWWMRLLAGVRTPWLTRVASAIDVTGSSWAVTALGLALVVALMILRRWRHLLVFLGSVFVLSAVTSGFYTWLQRPRPYDVTIIGGWGGFAIPSAPVVLLTALLVGIAYTLVVPGRLRSYAKLAIVVIVAQFVLAREYLGVDNPGDALYAVVLAVAITVAAFRLFTPNEVFPVVYRRGRTAHLDVTGTAGRGDPAGRLAPARTVGPGDQARRAGGLGRLHAAAAHAWRASRTRTLFAKLYAKNHVRADRWYKLWRTILYGSLEDETSFQTVRRFVEYEDYMLRLLYDAGIPVPDAVRHRGDHARA